jgi:outer membrane protein OmpA-like peptidoglycan-associated protein
MLLAFALPSHAKDEHWSEPIFIEAAIQQYLVPGIYSGLINPKLGFRGAMGYEIWNFRLALETGYTNIKGTNPLALNFTFVPLIFKVGYVLPIYKGFGLQANLGSGILFSNTTHYKSAIDMILENEHKSPTKSPLTHARLYATYTFPGNSVRLYAGGGVDTILEKKGAIPLPVIEVGASLRFSAFSRRKAEAPVLTFAHIPENIVIEEGPRGRTVRLLNAVYFEANTAVLIESYRPILDKAGEALKANPKLRLTLRGYAAPAGTAEGRRAVSRERAGYCMEYLARKYGIAANRMSIEYFGAEKRPEFAGASLESFRCVELIIE